MDRYVVTGGRKLEGTIKIDSAKNSVLPIIAASILADGITVLNDIPMLEDVFVICNVLRSIGADISIDKNKKIVRIDTKNIYKCEPSSELVRKMRASFLIMGPMLARFGFFKVSLPGGCNIGTRPIDLHLKGFKDMGAEIINEGGIVDARANKLKSTKIYLDFPSVGATENLLMAASLTEGETIIENAAEEPEIEDLADFLRSMGAKIIGAGTGTVTVVGVEKLTPVEYTPIFDRIEAGTFMVAAAITKSKITITNINERYIKSIIAKLSEIGVEITSSIDFLTIDATGVEDFNSVDIKTMPYPGFPTDMQAQMMVLLTKAKGSSIVTETIFENRFMHVGELTRMGAKIKVDGRSAIVEGPTRLSGCEVRATDLRAGAALILAALVSEGTTTIGDIYHIQRGYDGIDKKFQALGADVKLVKENEEILEGQKVNL